MGFESSIYGDRWAEIYDDVHHELSDPAHVDPIVDVLAELAGGGRALELGIGTGRIALPLASRGVEVHGIDVSRAMVGKLRQKPGGAGIPVVLGDFSDVGVEGEYSLIFVVFNTFFGLLTQDAQVRCFQNVARHLAKKGVFLIEAFVPDPTRFNRGQNISVQSVDTDRCRIGLERHDPVRQIVNSYHLILSADEVKLMPVKVRYVWPAELDLMARLAGMRLRHRWSDWTGSSFTASSARHISLYEVHNDS